MKTNQRVNTKFGTGTVIRFERITCVNAPIDYPSEYSLGDRIEIKLDDPLKWVIKGSNPYFYFSELIDICPCGDTTPYIEWLPLCDDDYPRCPNCGTS